MTDPSLLAYATTDDATFAKQAAYRQARLDYAKAVGNPVGARAVGGFPNSRRKAT